MRKVMLLLLVCVVTSCRDEKPAPPAAEPKNEPLKSIELKTSDSKPLNLATPAATSTEAAAPRLQMAQIMTSDGLRPVGQNSAPAPRKPVRIYEGAYVEPRGPCDGRGVAGYIGTGEERRPICAGETSRESRYGSTYGRRLYDDFGRSRAAERYELRGQSSQRRGSTYGYEPRYR